MSSKDDKKLQKGMIITDDISHYPILDFDDYVNALTNIITKSHPKFSIGIYGEWGTGKTTLMRSIYDKLEANNERLNDNNEKISIIPIWFNAWRYEREEQFAIIPLLKTIAYGIPDDEEFRDLKQKIKKGGINFLKKIPDIIPSIAGHYFGDNAKKITENAIDQFKKEFIPKMELLAEVDKETIYFDGLDNIQKELVKIRDKNDSFKIVVFVDDLDRCSPDKALQVLESIKVFLDVDGFIYVIGLSFNKISQLITAYYKDKYKDIGIEGEQYLKKIIQIPIILSDWNSDDIKSLMEDFIKNNVIENEDYQKIIKENIDLISTGLEENPREAKRFLNNFIVAQEILSKKGTKPKELLILQILNMRWNAIYRLIVNSNGKYLNNLKPYLDNKEELKKLITTKPEDSDLQPDLIILQKFRTDSKLWEFLRKNYDAMKSISDWTVYRRAAKITQDPIVQTKDIKDIALSLLKSGNVREFNELRLKNISSPIYLVGVDLTNASLEGANLMGASLMDAKLIGANLKGAKLVGTNLTGADLAGANLMSAKLGSAYLKNANLDGAKLGEAYLKNANLDGANLENAKLESANLEYADLRGANLTNANLVSANLGYAIMTRIKNYTGMKLNGETNFRFAYTNDKQLIEYITKHTDRVPAFQDTTYYPYNLDLET